MLTSIIICSYNRATYIVNAIDSLVQQSYSPSKFEVIVVDNNSTDNTTDVVNTYIANNHTHHLIYLNEPKQGASHARNTGAAIAKGQLLSFMDDDAVAAPNFLQEIENFHMQNPTVSGFGGIITPLYIPNKPTWMSHHVSSLVGNFNYGNTIKEFSPNRYPLESNMVVTAIAFNQISGFNTTILGVVGTLRIGGEGKDFFMRLKAQGHKVYYVPNIAVQHVVEVIKLTPEYMYRVASGIGRGERTRIASGGAIAFTQKLIEYTYKLGGAVVLGLGYTIKGNPQQFWPIVMYRVNALKGFLGY